MTPQERVDDLHSWGGALLTAPPSGLKTKGDFAFTIGARRLWNNGTKGDKTPGISDLFKDTWLVVLYLIHSGIIVTNCLMFISIM